MFIDIGGSTANCSIAIVSFLKEFISFSALDLGMKMGRIQKKKKTKTGINKIFELEILCFKCYCKPGIYIKNKMKQLLLSILESVGHKTPFFAYTNMKIHIVII